MPATSVKMRRAMAIAKNAPDQLYARNRGMLNMTSQQLSDFASTPETNLPMRAASPAGSLRDISQQAGTGRGGSRKAIAKRSGRNPISNLGKFAHPARGR